MGFYSDLGAEKIEFHLNFAGISVERGLLHLGVHGGMVSLVNTRYKYIFIYDFQ